MPRTQTKPQPQPRTMSSWSHSRWSTDNTCQYQAELKFIRRIKELERPLPSNKTEHANDRGTRIHSSAEEWVSDRQNSTSAQAPRRLPRELANFASEFEVLQNLYAEGRVTLEQNWNFDSAWRRLPDDIGPNHIDWRNIWLRVKSDIVVWLTPNEAVLIDLKTGKRQQNEIKHAEQMQLYQLAAFMRYPELERATTELWYLDIDELHSARFSREFGLRFFPRWNERGLELTSRVRHKPNPSIQSCRFCPFKNGSNKWILGTGDCRLNPPDTKFDDTTEIYIRKLKRALGE